MRSSPLPIITPASAPLPSLSGQSGKFPSLQGSSSVRSCAPIPSHSLQNFIPLITTSVVHYQWLNYHRVIDNSKYTDFNIRQFFPSSSHQGPPQYNTTHTLRRLAHLCNLASFAVPFSTTTNVFLCPFKKSNQSHYLPIQRSTPFSLPILFTVFTKRILLCVNCSSRKPRDLSSSCHSLIYAVSEEPCPTSSARLKRLWPFPS